MSPEIQHLRHQQMELELKSLGAIPEGPIASPHLSEAAILRREIKNILGKG